MKGLGNGVEEGNSLGKGSDGIGKGWRSPDTPALKGCMCTSSTCLLYCKRLPTVSCDVPLKALLMLTSQCMCGGACTAPRRENATSQAGNDLLRVRDQGLGLHRLMFPDRTGSGWKGPPSSASAESKRGNGGKS